MLTCQDRVRRIHLSKGIACSEVLQLGTGFKWPPTMGSRILVGSGHPDHRSADETDARGLRNLGFGVR